MQNFAQENLAGAYPEEGGPFNLCGPLDEH